MSNARYAVLGATIANNASLSGAVNTDGRTIVAIQMPADWTAASMTFQASADGATYWNVYDSAGTELSFTVAEDRHITVDWTKFLGALYVKVRSGTSGAAVNQGGERVVGLVLREFA